MSFCFIFSSRSSSPSNYNNFCTSQHRDKVFSKLPSSWAAGWCRINEQTERTWHPAGGNYSVNWWRSITHSEEWKEQVDCPLLPAFGFFYFFGFLTCEWSREGSRGLPTTAAAERFNRLVCVQLASGRVPMWCNFYDIIILIRRARVEYSTKEWMEGFLIWTERIKLRINCREYFLHNWSDLQTVWPFIFIYSSSSVLSLDPFSSSRGSRRTWARPPSSSWFTTNSVT